MLFEHLKYEYFYTITNSKHKILYKTHFENLLRIYSCLYMKQCTWNCTWKFCLYIYNLSSLIILNSKILLHFYFNIVIVISRAHIHITQKFAATLHIQSVYYWKNLKFSVKFSFILKNYGFSWIFIGIQTFSKFTFKFKFYLFTKLLLLSFFFLIFDNTKCW